MKNHKLDNMQKNETSGMNERHKLQVLGQKNLFEMTFTQQSKG